MHTSIKLTRDLKVQTAQDGMILLHEAGDHILVPLQIAKELQANDMCRVVPFELSKINRNRTPEGSKWS